MVRNEFEQVWTMLSTRCDAKIDCLPGFFRAPRFLNDYGVVSKHLWGDGNSCHRLSRQLRLKGIVCSHALLALSLTRYAAWNAMILTGQRGHNKRWAYLGTWCDGPFNRIWNLSCKERMPRDIIGNSWGINGPDLNLLIVHRHETNSKLKPSANPQLCDTLHNL